MSAMTTSEKGESKFMTDKVEVFVEQQEKLRSSRKRKHSTCRLFYLFLWCAIPLSPNVVSSPKADVKVSEEGLLPRSSVILKFL